MPLRRRLALVAAATVGVAIALVAMVCYLEVRDQLLSQVDQLLSDQALLVEQTQGQSLMHGNIPGLPASAGGSAPYWQIVGTGGQYVAGGGGEPLPEDRAVNAVASGQHSRAFEDATVGGVHLRVYAFHMVLEQGFGQYTPIAVELARPLGPTDRVLSSLRLILILLCAVGVALAAALGRLAARRVLVPLAGVAQAAQDI